MTSGVCLPVGWSGVLGASVSIAIMWPKKSDAFQGTPGGSKSPDFGAPLLAARKFEGALSSSSTKSGHAELFVPYFPFTCGHMHSHTRIIRKCVRDLPAFFFVGPYHSCNYPDNTHSLNVEAVN